MHTHVGDVLITPQTKTNWQQHLRDITTVFGDVIVENCVCYVPFSVVTGSLVARGDHACVYAPELMHVMKDIAAHGDYSIAQAPNALIVGGVICAQGKHAHASADCAVAVTGYLCAKGEGAVASALCAKATVKPALITDGGRVVLPSLIIKNKGD